MARFQVCDYFSFCPVNKLLQSFILYLLLFYSDPWHGQVRIAPKLPVEVRFQSAYSAASLFCKSVQPVMDSVATRFSLQSSSLLPIVFPECMRYSVRMDMAETTSLEVLYVNFGKGYADFSIGRFQMKPSFVEQLEEKVKSDSLALKAYQFITKYGEGNNSKAIRMQRISRMESLQWQMIYLCCFYSVAELRFHAIVFANASDRIRFYATAYNRGFMNSQMEIERWQTICIFPSGKVDVENNYPYGEVSIHYYSDKNN
jgi:hypothetical protein